MTRWVLPLAAAMALAACRAPLAGQGGSGASTTPPTGGTAGAPGQAGTGATDTVLSTNPGVRLAPEAVVWPDGRRQPFSAGRFRVLEAAAGDTAVRGHVTGPGGIRLEDTAVYFTDAADRYLVVRAAEDPAIAALIAPQTDVEGAFRTPAVFPEGMVVTASALLSHNRRLVGIGTAGGGDVPVTVGSTYAVEFLRDAAGSPEAFLGAIASPSAVEAVALEGRRADDLVRDGILPVPSPGADGDLVMGNGARLAMRYAAGALAARPEIAVAWRGILPRPFHTVVTLAGNFRRRFAPDGEAAPATSRGMAEPIGITQGAPGDDAVYVAEYGARRIRRIAASGSAEPVAGQGDPAADDAALSADGTPISQARLGLPWDLEADPQGNLASTFHDLEGFDTVGFWCRSAGKHFGRTMAAGTFYRLGAPDGLAGYVDGPLATARYRSPSGLAFDDAGNLYVADRRNNRIRRIDRATGGVSTVLGDGWPWIDAIQTATGDLPPSVLTAQQAGVTGTGAGSGSGTDPIAVPDYGRLVDRPGGPASGLAASFNRPIALAWRRHGDVQELYILDSYNNAVRRARAAYPGDFRSAEVGTVVGVPETFVHADRGYSVTLGARGPATDGEGTASKLDLARYDPRNRALAQAIRVGGAALDPVLGRLFFIDTNNAAIRMLDLATGRVRTVAAHDPDRPEGDSMRVLLSFDLGGLAVLRDHSVVFTDVANQVVRRLVLSPPP